MQTTTHSADYRTGRADAENDTRSLQPHELAYRSSLLAGHATTAADRAYTRGYIDGVNAALDFHDAIRDAETRIAFDLRSKVTR